MTCAICLEDGAAYACECCAYHAGCFSNVLMRVAAQQCPICHCKYDRDMLASASGIAYERTLDMFGSTHTTTRVRQVEHATALADARQVLRARPIFVDIIEDVSQPKWLACVSQIELARLEKDVGNVTTARDMLVELLPCLLLEKQSWAWYERIELYTVLGGCYVALQKWDHAEMFLFKAIDGHLANEHAHYRKVARCMEEIAKFYEASSNNEYAHEARRVALSVLVAEERDAGRLALAELELARAEVRIGGKHSAVARYTAAIRTLRKRKAIVAREALPAARMELASLVQPTKRLRTKTLPEDC